MKRTLNLILTVFILFIVSESMLFFNISSHIIFIVVSFIAAFILFFTTKTLTLREPINNNITTEPVNNNREEMTSASLTLANSSKDMYVSTAKLYDSSKHVYNASKAVLQSVEGDNINILSMQQEIENISVEINSINNEAIETKDLSKVNLDAIKVGSEMINSSQIKINELIALYENFIPITNNLKEASKEISKVTTSINDIANRTNLLSLNASIEAARAGEAGKGFSIVASEINKLASQSKSFSLEIDKLLHAIEENVEDLGGIALSTEGKISSTKNTLVNVDDALLKISKASNVLDNNIDNILKTSSGIIKTAESTMSKSHLLTETHEETYSSMEEITADIEVQWNLIETFNQISKSITEVSDTFLNLSIDHKVYEKLREVGKNIMNYTGDKSSSALNKLCSKININELYYANKNGIFEHYTSQDAAGLNIYELNKDFKTFVESNEDVKIFPLARRLDSGELYIFMAVKRLDAPGVISAGISINNLLKL